MQASRIRSQLRHRRRSLHPRERRTRARLLARQLVNSPPVRRSHRIALFIPHDGEIDLTPLIRRLWQAGKSCFLPALHHDRLWFLPYRSDTPMQNNRFGIPEPAVAARRRASPSSLDLVLAPLVAFDRKGNRLGMGGGYYDRTFAYLASRSHWHRPLIMGTAYGFQEVERLPSQPWDVPLHAVATEQGIRWFTLSR